MTPSACLMTSSIPAQACSISACQYSVRWRVERDLLAQVLLDRELLREVDDLEVVRADLEPTRGALVFDDLAVHDDSGLDECLLRRRECFRGYGVTRDCDLHRAGCIADHHERLAADGPGAVDPASQLDLLAGMASLRDFRDGDHEPPPYLAGSRLPFRGSKRRISRRAV